MHWDYLAIIIFLGAAMPLLGRRRVRLLLQRPETSTRERLRLYASTIAVQWVIAALLLWRTRAHGVTLADLGLALPYPLLTVAVALGLAALILGNQLLALRMAARLPEDSGAITRQLAARIFPQTTAERSVFFFVVVTVAICEEIIYRGFLQYLFGSLTASLAVGLVLSAAFFSVAHLYQGRRGLITTYVVGFLFGVVRAWTYSQLPGMAAHFVADIVAGFLLPARIRELSGPGGQGISPASSA
jgi:membrane protease YdiL (CAAX protease family)